MSHRMSMRSRGITWDYSGIKVPCYRNIISATACIKIASQHLKCWKIMCLVLASLGSLFMVFCKLWNSAHWVAGLERLDIPADGVCSNCSNRTVNWLQHLSFRWDSSPQSKQDVGFLPVYNWPSSVSLGLNEWTLLQDMGWGLLQSHSELVTTPILQAGL
jgi:hypothetical protein